MSADRNVRHVMGAVLLVLAACGKVEDASTTTPPAAAPGTPVASDTGLDAAADAAASVPVPGKTYALVVYFSSPGSGIDRDAHDRLSQLVAEIGGARLGHVSTRHGPEGEVGECFDLVQLSADERASFIARARSAASGRDTLVRENAICTGA